MFLAAMGVEGILKSIAQLIVLILIFAFILFLAYWSSKLTAKIQSKAMKNSNVEIIETVRLHNNKYMQIVKIGGKYLALGIGRDEVRFLSELDGEKLVKRTAYDSDSEKNQEFSGILSKFAGTEVNGKQEHHVYESKDEE